MDDIERIGSAMREAYAEATGYTDIIPWERAESRPLWIVCAKAAVKAMVEGETDRG